MAAAKADAPAAGDIVEQLFEQAYKINEDQEALNKTREGVRSSLRSLRNAGVLAPEQATEVEELYPTVERKRKPKDATDDTPDENGNGAN